MGKTPSRRAVLVVLDGWGHSTMFEGNAIAQADTPNFDKLWRGNPHTLLQAAGEAVGLPWGEMGNSEVGHLNIGAGRVVPQDLPRISAAIDNGSFFKNKALRGACQHARESGGRLHLIGLASAGGVHAHLRHLVALLDLARQEKVPEVLLHIFTDGRDTPTKVARTYLDKLEEAMVDKGIGRIASISGRYYAMDRDNRWDRTQLAFDTIALGKGNTADSVGTAVEQAYAKGLTDEFIEPTIILDKGKPFSPMQDKDSAIFFNYRPDRIRQLSEALAHAEFDRFDRDGYSGPGYAVTFTEYEPHLPAHVAFRTPEVIDPLSKVVSDAGIRQFHIAETEKYPHVTFFFNGGREEPFSLEERLLTPSPQVATYDQQPEMSAPLMTDELLKRISDPQYGFIMINFANPDMVGHSGDLSATVKAIHAVDQQIGRIVEACEQAGCVLVVTADHGNAEQLVNFTSGEADTEHSVNPVPFILRVPASLADEVSFNSDRLSLEMDVKPTGLLGDVAPTILNLLEIPLPEGMKGYGLL